MKCPLVLHCHDTWIIDGVYHVPISLFKGFRDSYFCQLFRYINLARIQRLVDCADSIVVPSNHMARKICLAYPASASKVSVIPNPIRQEFYEQNQNSTHEQLGGEQNHITVCISSASAVSDPVKNLQLLPEIAYHVLAMGYKLTILSVGSDVSSLFGDIPQGLSIIASRYDNDSSMLKGIISKSDMYLSLSLFESFGLAVAEALVLGKPVCAFDSEGINELVTHKYNGYLASAGSSEDFAYGINYIYKKISSGLRLNVGIPRALSSGHAISMLTSHYAKLSK
jgi:glycosyltransferase involved in cell wall biosynthesis